MKLLLKFVGALAIVLIAVQPLIADCNSGTLTACAPGCPMNQAGMGNMSDMGSDCPMTSGDFLSNCSQDCCSQTATQALAQLAPPDRPKLILANSAIALPVTASDPTKAFAVRTAFAIPAASPPRYILYQVFRI